MHAVQKMSVLESSVFASGPEDRYKWQLKIYPGRSNYNGSISLYLVLASQPDKDKSSKEMASNTSRSQVGLREFTIGANYESDISIRNRASVEMAIFADGKQKYKKESPRTEKNWLSIRDRV